MSVLVAIAITTGLLSAVWGWASIALGLLTWAGFLGCSTFFANPADGAKGLTLSIASNMSGVFWAMAIIHLSQVGGGEIWSYVVTGVISTFMCLQAKKDWLSFIPGTFIGSCATFASGGDWQLVAPSLVVGVLFGFSMKTSGLWLQAKLAKAEPQPEAARQQ